MDVQKIMHKYLFDTKRHFFFGSKLKMKTILKIIYKYVNGDEFLKMLMNCRLIVILTVVGQI